MAGEWGVLTLRDAGVSLMDCDHRTPPAAETGYPYVAIPQLHGGRIEFKDARRISSAHFAEWTRKARPSADDVVLSRRCNPGETAFVSPGVEFALGQNLVLLRADGERVHPPFLRWLTRGPQWWEQIGKFINVGAVFDSLKCADVPKFELTIPPLPEQRAIAHILGTLDDKIELNRRRNQTLEAMARALFKDWFVDFGPVRAKMEGRDDQDGLVSGQRHGGRASGPTEPYLPADLWQLFPDRLDDEGKPEGWELRPVYDFANVVYGAPFASKQFNTVGAGTPLIRIRDLASHEPGVWTEQIHPKGHFIEPGDIVVGMDGEFRLHVWKGQSAWLNQRVCHFEPLPGVPSSFLTEALIEPLAFFERGKVGTTVIHLGKSDIDTFRLLHPGDSLLKAFGHVGEPWLAAIVRNALESRILAHLRDTLLPKLISGELRIADAERFLETHR